ncbi:hypothetical protein [Candidatus Poriferisodalis sp.]|uniref:hypothetical protein n=1 Tax=Candidatus Poriferisodalis sp. TaxID=3101277 RepID=UPI003B02BDC3
MADAAIPVVFALTLSQGRTNAIAGFLTLGLGIGTFSYLRRNYPEYSSLGFLRSHVLTRHQLLHWSSLAAVLGHLNYFLFAWSANHIGMAAATVLFNAWALPWAFSLYLTTRSVEMKEYGATEHKWDRPTSRTVSLILLAITGVGIVTLGQRQPDDVSALSWSDTVLGGLLGIGAALAVALTATNFAWARRLKLRVSINGDVESSRFDVAGAILAQSISAIVFGIVLIALDWSFEWSSHGLIPLVSALAGGIVFRTVTSTQVRIANRQSSNPGINAVAYLSPIVALLALQLVKFIGDAGSIAWLSDAPGIFDLRSLVVGTAAVVAVGVLINFDPEPPLAISLVSGRELAVNRWGYATLVIALWSCGTFVLYRDEIVMQSGIDGFVWSTSDVWGILALSATVFALLLSFRVSRVGERALYEEDALVQIARTLESAERRSLADAEGRRTLWELDHSRGLAEVVERYRTLRGQLSSLRTNLESHAKRDFNSGDESPELIDERQDAHSEPEWMGSQEISQKLGDAEIALDGYFRSKQRGRDFPELIALMNLGGLVVALGLLARPVTVGLGAILVDVFAILFSATTLFIMTNLIDMRRERDSAIFDGQVDDIRPNMALELKADRRFERAREQWLCLFVAVGIFVAFCALVVDKWSG